MWSSGTTIKTVKVWNASEVKLVNSGMTCPLNLRGSWDVISSVWFEKWKIFVDYGSNERDDRSDEVFCLSFSSNNCLEIISSCSRL